MAELVALRLEREMWVQERFARRLSILGELCGGQRGVGD